MLTKTVLLFILKYCHGFVTWENVLLEIGSRKSFYEKFANEGSPPTDFDWRDRDAVSPVKDQLQCNACWAFAIIANIESQLKIYTNKKVLLSEQFLIDCDTDQQGCEAGSMVRTYANIVSKFLGVLRYDNYYPYANGQLKCRWQKPPPSTVLVTGYKRVAPNEDTMVEALWRYGPLSAAMVSSCISNYIPGSIHSPPHMDFHSEELDHAALIIGYGVEEDRNGYKKAFWTIKNSWGENWGDGGFFRLERGRNACGIAQDVSFSFVT